MTLPFLILILIRLVVGSASISLEADGRRWMWLVSGGRQGGGRYYWKSEI
jgi:hypothetical protein